MKEDFTKPEMAIVTRMIMAYTLVVSGRPAPKEDEAAFMYWDNLFKAYNQATDDRLRMYCRPCYTKVYLWYQKHKEDTESTD